MKIRSKSYGDELEIIKMKEADGFTITVEVFQVLEGYKSFARNNLIHHDDLIGCGVHKDKQESANLAVQDLWKSMEEFDNPIC